MKYTITTKCIEGDACIVQNFRRKTNVWESGTVIEIDARLRSNGTFRLKYWVRLDRMSKNGNYIFLTVGDDAIEKAKP